MTGASVPLMIRGWSFLASPLIVGSGPPPSALGESLTAADTAASRIAKAAVTSFIVVCVCMWVVLFSRSKKIVDKMQECKSTASYIYNTEWAGCVLTFVLWEWVSFFDHVNAHDLMRENNKIMMTSLDFLNRDTR